MGKGKSEQGESFAVQMELSALSELLNLILAIIFEKFSYSSSTTLYKSLGRQDDIVAKEISLLTRNSVLLHF